MMAKFWSVLFTDVSHVPITVPGIYKLSNKHLFSEFLPNFISHLSISLLEYNYSRCLTNIYRAHEQ